MRTLVFAAVACLAASSICAAAPAARLPVAAAVSQVDWQDPQSLPRSLRNHCFYDRWGDRKYCSDHCGYEYQVYFCSPQSFGCCRLGRGYCDWGGLLRCSP
jgi:hypothetical protein